MITSTKNYTKKTLKNKTDRQNPRPNGKSKAIQTKSHKEAYTYTLTKREKGGASLVVQWLRIHLPMLGTQVRALVQEDSTCRGAAKPLCHNCWAWALEPASHNYWSPCATTTEVHMPRAHAPQQEKPPRWEACTLQWRVTPIHHK